MTAAEDVAEESDCGEMPFEGVAAGDGDTGELATAGADASAKPAEAEPATAG